MWSSTPCSSTCSPSPPASRPGELVHVIADCHIYDRHIPLVEKMIAREPYDAPKFRLDPAITDFYSFTKDSVSLEGYRYHDFPWEIPVAI